MKPVIGITMGDPAGIGPEIAVKALARKEIYERSLPVIIGDLEAIKEANEFTGLHLTIHEIENVGQAKGEHGTLDLINLKMLAPGSWQYKQVSALAGKAAFSYIEKAIHLALQGAIQAVVTGPINKAALNLAGYHYAGHTEIFARLTGTKDYAMMLASKVMRVVHVTTHVSMREACDLITKDRVYTVIKLAYNAMKMLGIADPRIAVAGLNPHCSEDGLFGDEEAKGITPAIRKAKEEGINVEGPVPPDTVFVKALAGQYDVVVVMYHDQGHIPVKLTGFKLDAATNKFTSVSGVNCTLGLPIIRTSVDHGTAFGKAGEGRANEESLVDAINMAVQMARSRGQE
ncbi:4-hydroxythreonine-4-phosphate dehydrogenase PdxA [Desulfofundulus thermobenzoicus]|uniref:4-hydroxythreonine-4-phosphate dehydrogenase PdxA n=1 Tax=Desulfofundulus thermobenzoicus TaxID=29376 RepID=A0A6N7IQ67_9FIRM|nr:4-hydroxythreonine-4-phosphate dehydrogenase PdxA [Desulfofundulus thermobenzoicus]MQL52061.1 4-hydroxythreonine-4-phosphate dehydrogenase PdxA [Desulfofundulus thermobenzoicus]